MADTDRDPSDPVQAARLELADFIGPEPWLERAGDVIS